MSSSQPESPLKIDRFLLEVERRNILKIVNWFVKQNYLPSDIGKIAIQPNALNIMKFIKGYHNYFFSIFSLPESYKRLIEIALKSDRALATLECLMRHATSLLDYGFSKSFLLKLAVHPLAELALEDLANKGPFPEENRCIEKEIDAILNNEQPDEKENYFYKLVERALLVTEKDDLNSVEMMSGKKRNFSELHITEPNPKSSRREAADFNDDKETKETKEGQFRLWITNPLADTLFPPVALPHEKNDTDNFKSFLKVLSKHQRRQVKSDFNNGLEKNLMADKQNLKKLEHRIYHKGKW